MLRDVVMEQASTYLNPGESSIEANNNVKSVIRAILRAPSIENTSPFSRLRDEIPNSNAYDTHGKRDSLIKTEQAVQNDRCLFALYTFQGEADCASAIAQRINNTDDTTKIAESANAIRERYRVLRDSGVDRPLAHLAGELSPAR